MAKAPDKTPFWKEIYLKVEGEIGMENTITGVALGVIVTMLYWKHCKN